MQKLLDKDGNVLSEDPWQIMPRGFDGMLNSDHMLVPVQYWLDTLPDSDANSVCNDQHASGIWLDSDIELEPLADHISTWDCIGIHFQTFMDGRGFSLARLLREQYNYRGELRAFGNIIPDQFYYLARCGFDTFLLEDYSPDFDPLPYLNNFTVSYQGSVDQPQPLFRRRT
ncbi:MAG: oxidoreductase [Gammaproteobacteria bacterium]|nr:MAG: oxidoreductase [Gammaproteobacteria bacterium]RLA52791.1 MAG: oxidoreductase [Gammaproteobacteria bacterium]